MMLKTFVCIFLTLASSYAHESTPPVLAQKDFSDMACGPCAYVNTLLQGGDDEALDLLEGDSALEKAMNFAERFGKLPSLDNEGLTAYTEENGTTDRDLLAMSNRFHAENGLPELSGTYILRGERETQKDFEARIHRLIEASIEAGFPPLLAIRSASAELRNQKSEFLWYAHQGHWVSVTELEKVDDDISLITVADSGTGRLLAGTIYSPSPRNCLVPMSFEVNEKGNVDWDWVPGARCFFLSMPAMTLGTREKSFHERTYIALRFLITPTSVLKEVELDFQQKSRKDARKKEK